jgi:hypothetical protein
MRTRWIGVLAWVASASFVWAALVPYGFRWVGLPWLTAIGVMALWSMRWAGGRRDRSIAQLLDDIDGDWRLCHNRLPRPYAQHI